MIYIIQGFIIGIAYVAPIGTQNLYVINTAFNKSRYKAMQVALITSLFDILLALSCFFGVGILIDKYIIIRQMMLLFGSIFIFYIGINLLLKPIEIIENDKTNTTFKKTITACFVVTFLNPQAIIDGTLLLGGIRATLNDPMATYFIMGTALASLIWFTSLSLIISIYHQKLNLTLLKTINSLASLIMIFYSLKLVYHFLILIT